MEEIDILEEITNSEFKVFLFTSYGVDLAFFESYILRRLRENNCTYIGGYIDNIFLEDNNISNAKHLGSSYVIRPVHIANAFHPKVYLLLDKNKAKVIVGSGNLTVPGFIKNIEFFKSFEYDEVNKENLFIIRKVYNMFRQYHKLFPTKMMKNIFDKTDEYQYLKQESDFSNSLYFLDNIDSSIFNQIRNIIEEDIKKVDVLVPYFDNKLKVINEIKSKFSPNKINVYIQNYYSNFPLDNYEDKGIELKGFVFKKDSKKRYHAKLLSFEGIKHSYLIYGSANCSKQALLNVMKESGNSETVIVEIVSNNYFENFKENNILNVKIDENFTVNENTYNFQKNNIKFIEAVKDKSGLIVKFYSENQIDSVSINGLSGDINKNGSIYTIDWKDDLNLASNLINLDVYFENTKHKSIKCWYNDRDALIRNQSNFGKYIYSKLEEDPELKNLENVIKIFDDLSKRLILTDEDIENNENYSMDNTTNIQRKAELNNDDTNEISYDIEDYFADEKDENEIIYGSMNGIDILAILINHLLQPFSSNNESNMKNNKCKKSNQLSNNDLNLLKRYRNRIKRFIKKFNNGISSKNYLKRVSPDIFLKNILIYTSFLWDLYEKSLKLKTNEKDILSFMDKKYFIQKYLEVINSLIIYSKTNVLDNFEKMDILISQFLDIILGRYALIEFSDLNMKHKSQKKREIKLLLNEIDKNLCSVREDYKDYLSLFYHSNRVSTVNNIYDLNKRVDIFENELFNFYTFKTLNFKLNQKNIIVEEIKKGKPFLSILIDKDEHKDISLLQLELLNYLLRVREWEYSIEFILELHFINHSKRLKHRLIYNENENTLIKEDHYKNNNIFINKKEKVNKNTIFRAAYKYNSDIITQGFSNTKIVFNK